MNYEEWKIYKIGQIGEIVGGGTPTTTRPDFFNGDIPWITPKDMSVNKQKYVYKGERSITLEALNSSSARLLPKGTVLLTSRAPIGYVAIAQANMCTNQGFKSIIPNNEICDNEFIYYWLINNIRLLISKASGTTFLEISGGVLKGIEIVLPPLPEQRVMARILSSLDDKIELNNCMNKTLEEIAQAIFKHWFVDFEFPDENGNPYKSSGGKMVESELGLIPEGWRVGKINDIGSIVGGGTPSKTRADYFCQQGVPWITPKDLSGRNEKYISHGATDISHDGFKNSSAQLMPKGTVLFSSRAPIGYIAIALNEITTNQGFKSFIPNKAYGSDFIYQLLKRISPSIESQATGSTFKEVSAGELKQYRVVLPDHQLALKFEQLSSSLGLPIQKNESENSILAQLRDSLLPKLISGEVRIPKQ